MMAFKYAHLSKSNATVERIHPGQRNLTITEDTLTTLPGPGESVMNRTDALSLLEGELGRLRLPV